MKVLHLLSSARYSGAENVACQIISMFNNSDIEMLYCSPKGQISDALSQKGVAYKGLASFSYTCVKKVVKEFQPDIIHAHDVKASLLACLVFPKGKIISHMHINHADMNSWGVKPILYLLSNAWYNHIFWVSDSAFNNYKFHNLIKGKSSILYNVIDGNATIGKVSKDSNDYNYDIVYVGRITYQKNPEKLINVLKLIADKRKSTKIAIVGSGDMEDNMKLLARQFGLENNITFLGFRDNPTKIMYQSKLLIMTSRFEGTPMTALEAMCLGLPIVSTPTDGMVELVINGETGYLAEENDIIAERCIAILSNPALQQQMSRKTKERFALLSNLQTYKSIINKHYRAAVRR